MDNAMEHMLVDHAMNLFICAHPQLPPYPIAAQQISLQPNAVLELVLQSFRTRLVWLGHGQGTQPIQICSK